MELGKLRELAEVADRQTASLSVVGAQCPWFDPSAMAAKLGMDVDDPDAAYIAAADPQTVLKLIEVAEAAQVISDNLSYYGREHEADARILRTALQGLRGEEK